VSTELLFDITTFVLAVLVGFEVISKVPATLHTPLMSGANSIHGVVVIGALMVTSTASGVFGYTIAFIAVAFAAMNVVGGYAVTDRMLEMFKAKPITPREAPPEPAPALPHETAAPSQTVHTVDAGTTR
jgi:NAD(P) transhydrogenase subunit alpha